MGIDGLCSHHLHLTLECTSITLVSQEIFFPKNSRLFKRTLSFSMTITRASSVNHSLSAQCRERVGSALWSFLLLLSLQARPGTKCLIQFGHRLLLQRRQDVRISIQRHADVAMAQNFLHDLWMHPHTEQDGCRTMPQVVKPHRGQSGLTEQLVKFLEQPVRMKKRPCIARKH